MITTRRAKVGLTALFLAIAAGVGAGMALAAGDAPHIDRQKWTFGGFRGHFDDAQLQRGFKVYTEVCARCHSIKRLYFRNLAEPSGPAFPEAAVKSLAATYQVDAVPNEQGKVVQRPATLTDALPAPYKNEQEARFMQNGALPPDLSLIAKARSVETNAPFYMVPVNMVADVALGYQEGGADYIYAYLMGYAQPPADMKLADGMTYNKAFIGHQTAMPNPLAGGDGAVKYDDDAPSTVDNYARDVTAFLAWVADPRLEERKRMGWLVLFYMAITAVLLGLAKRRVWRSVH